MLWFKLTIQYRLDKYVTSLVNPPFSLFGLVTFVACSRTELGRKGGGGSTIESRVRDIFLYIHLTIILKLFIYISNLVLLINKRRNRRHGTYNLQTIVNF